MQGWKRAASTVRRRTENCALQRAGVYATEKPPVRIGTVEKFQGQEAPLVIR